MPVAVVALAAGSFAAGASAFAAATTLAGMVAAGATMVGAALTVVGTVTGNAKLTKIGAIVGIVGAVGTGLVNMAGAGAEAAAGAGASAAGDVAADVATTGAGEAAASAAGDAITTSAVDLGGTAASNTGGGLLDAATNAGTSAAPGSLIEAASSATPQAAGTTGTAAASAGGAGTAAQQAGSAAFDAGQTAVGQANTINAFKAASPLEQLGQGGGGGLLDSIESHGSAINSAGPVADTSLLGGIGNAAQGLQSWAKANPLLAKAALEGGAAFVKGAVPSAQDKAMMDAYKQQAETAKRRAAWGAGRTTY